MSIEIRNTIAMNDFDIYEKGKWIGKIHLSATFNQKQIDNLIKQLRG